MYLTDLHMHSRCSPDGSYSMTEMARAAAEAGLAELCFTDHCDLMDLHGAFTPEFCWAPLEQEYREAQIPKGLTARFGIELGEAQEDVKAAQQILDHAHLDFVIGSIHNMSRAAGGADFYYIKYQTKAQCYDCLDDYFAQMLSLTRWGGFDVLGHVSYPLRYMRNRDKQNVDLKPYWDQLEEIFRLIAEQGKGIELNTNRGRSLSEWLPILRLYRDCGGEIVTVGSDAHVPEHVALGVKEGYELLKAANFRYVATYKERKPNFWRLDA